MLLNSIGDICRVDDGNFSILNVVAVFKYHIDVVDAPVILELNHDNSMLAIEIIGEGFVEDLSNICYWDVNVSQSSNVNISPSTSEELDMPEIAI